MPQNKKWLLSELAKSYPSISVVDIDKILQEVQSIISKISKAIELIMVFLVAAGIVLLRSTMVYSFDNKLKQSAILRTLGASQNFIERCFRFEYVWLAILASIMAMGALEIVTFLLYTQIFEIAFQFHALLWLVIPLATLVLMLLASWQDSRRVSQAEPMSLIHQN